MISNKCKTIIKQWLNYLTQELNYSSNTHNAYRTDLQNFLIFCANNLGQEITLQTLQHISTQEIRSWLNQRKINDITSRSNARALSVIRNFYQYLKTKESISNQAIFNISIPKQHHNLPRPLSQQNIETLLQNISHHIKWVEKRDRAIISLLYGCGLRISEALSLKVSEAKSDIINITGKGNKARMVPCLPYIKTAIQEYIKLCPYLLNVNQPLFVGIRGKQLTRNNFANHLKDLRRTMGLPESTTPHAFRHSFATHLLKANTDIRLIQELLGHTNLSTTQNYTKIEKTHLLAEYLKHHPKAK